MAEVSEIELTIFHYVPLFETPFVAMPEHAFIKEQIYPACCM